MKIVIFGLSVSSSWGNGHATLWRGLCTALAHRGHSVVFFERDTPYYASTRDLFELPGGELRLYTEWAEALPGARSHLREADVAIVTSYCPDAVRATDLIVESPRVLRVFYDLDTPITLSRVAAGEPVDYIGPRGLRDFDLVLSYTGGRSLEELRRWLGARRVAPLYGSVDPHVHMPVAPNPAFQADLGYIGTYAADRNQMLHRLLVEPAARLPHRKFLIAGSMYDQTFPWRENIFFLNHLPPGDHSAFYSSSGLILNVTRRAMAENGYCPSGRLFEAAACGAAVLTDNWVGLDRFFSPGEEILCASSTEEAIEALQRGPEELARIGRAARERTLSEHTAAIRAAQLEMLLEEARPDLALPPLPAEIWGIVPAAGKGTRIQPLAFSKELLPVCAQGADGERRPRAVSDYLVERLVLAGANRLCFVISPSKSDILEYYRGSAYGTPICYAVQSEPSGLCDAIFRSAPFLSPQAMVLVGLPDTVWFPIDALLTLPDDTLSFLLFPVQHPECFDAVVFDQSGVVQEIQVKHPTPASHWIWGAFKMPGAIFHELHDLWKLHRDEYVGTLVNRWIAQGGVARCVRAGTTYIDVGAMDGYFDAIRTLADPETQAAMKGAS